MGGSFNLIYYDLSKKILEHKLEDIEAAHVDYITTSCMGCMIQLQDGIDQRRIKTKVVHLMEVIEKGTGGRENESCRD
jgi:Fe-S oxidoreductase